MAPITGTIRSPASNTSNLSSVPFAATPATPSQPLSSSTGIGSPISSIVFGIVASLISILTIGQTYRISRHRRETQNISGSHYRSPIRDSSNGSPPLRPDMLPGRLSVQAPPAYNIPLRDLTPPSLNEHIAHMPEDVEEPVGAIVC